MPAPSSLISDIYLNFSLSNQVILHSRRAPTPPLKHKLTMLNQLLEPFAKTARYPWGAEIPGHFLRSFWRDFDVVWVANREQFYEALLLNCRVDLKDTDQRGFQHYFYARAIQFLEDTMPDTSLEGLEEDLPRGLPPRGRVVSAMEGVEDSGERE